MREILYLEVPISDTVSVRSWLQTDFQPGNGEKVLTPEGLRLRISAGTTNASGAISEKLPTELSVFVWSVQQTTYLKVFRWGEQAFPKEGQILQRLTTGIRRSFRIDTRNRQRLIYRNNQFLQH